MNALSLGFSPCPNDTFIFYALVHGLVKSSLSFQKPFLEDVETLNSWAMQNRLDVTKLSFHALGHVLEDYCVLSAGSALGRGCGPLIVASRQLDIGKDRSLKIGIPGKFTTASLLFQMFAPACTNLIEMRFESIMPAIRSGIIDAGVIIHESRFTYTQEGLICIRDLGQWWEETSGHPIPLGCIAARREYGKNMIAKIDEAIRSSLEKAFENPQACLPYIRQHSQEIDEKVVQDHIGLYVNEYSKELGDEGMKAVVSFLDRGRRAGILPESTMPIMV